MLPNEVAEQVEEAFRTLGALSRLGWSVAILPREIGFAETQAGDTLPLLVRLERGGILIEAKCERTSEVASTLAGLAHAFE